MGRVQKPNIVVAEDTAILDRRNPGAPLDLEWLRSLRVSGAAVERSAAVPFIQGAPRADQLTALLLRAVSCFDLTPTALDESRGPLRAACATARQPIDPSTLRDLGVQHLPLQVGALCVRCDYIADAAQALRLSGIPVAGWSSASGPSPGRLEEIASCSADGAEEIDAKLPVAPVARGDWAALYNDVASMRSACGALALKAALPQSASVSPGKLFRAALVCAMAGADFVAVPWAGDSTAQTIAKALRAYYERTGARVGLKLGPGIETARQALDALALAKHTLGAEWIRPALFRMTTDGSLAGVDRQLEHYAHGPARRAA